MMKKYLFALIASVCILFGEISVSRAETLIFFYSPGCMYCEAWREEILPIYPKTEEGKRLPLREVNLDGRMPDDLKHLIRPSFTPTFVILDDQNQEAGRVLGYNKEFFWDFLAHEIEKLGPKKASL